MVWNINGAMLRIRGIAGGAVNLHPAKPGSLADGPSTSVDYDGIPVRARPRVGLAIRAVLPARSTPPWPGRTPYPHDPTTTYKRSAPIPRCPPPGSHYTSPHPPGRPRRPVASSLPATTPTRDERPAQSRSTSEALKRSRDAGRASRRSWSSTPRKRWYNCDLETAAPTARPNARDTTSYDWPSTRSTDCARSSRSVMTVSPQA